MLPLPRTPLLTPRLLLRPYEPTDATAFFELLHTNRSRLQPSFPDRLQTVTTLADVPSTLTGFTLDWDSGRFYVFGIWHHETQAYLGDICLMPHPPSGGEIGYYLRAEAEGYGYAREALAAIVDFGFHTLDAHTLLIRCFADNARGQAVAQAVGFAVQSLPRRPRWFNPEVVPDNIVRLVRARLSER
jgi:ribosomal-protein-alanine N-acetyltransferase